jgi:hypothetical protein
MRSMVFVDVGDLDEAALTAWVDLGVTFAASLPPK